MEWYIGTFFITWFCLFLAEKTSAKKIAYFLVPIAILIPCLLAGLRARNIGTDVRVYAEPIYTAAKNSDSFGEYLNFKFYQSWKYVYVKEFEIGFTSVVYLVTKLFGQFSAVLTAIELLIIVPLYAGLRRLKKSYSYSISFGVLTFLLMNYNVTLNMMRQWIAISIIIYGFSYLIENKKREYVWCIVIAFLFHTSAIMGLLILLIYNYTVNQNTHDNFRFRIGSHIITHDVESLIVVFFVGCIVMLSLSVILKILSVIGLSKYLIYIRGQISFLPNQMILRMPLFVIFTCCYKNWKEKDKNVPFFYAMLTLDFLTSQLASITENSGRISTYFSAYCIVSLASITETYREASYKRILIKAMLVIYLLIYWYYYFVVKGIHATVPFVFA